MIDNESHESGSKDGNSDSNEKAQASSPLETNDSDRNERTNAAEPGETERCLSKVNATLTARREEIKNMVKPAHDLGDFLKEVGPLCMIAGPEGAYVTLLGAVIKLGAHLREAKDMKVAEAGASAERSRCLSLRNSGVRALLEQIDRLR